MVIINPNIKEQLRILREIKYGYAKKQPAGVIDLAIGMLNPHDIVRALCVVTHSFKQLSQKQKLIMELLRKTTVDIRQLVKDSPNMTKEEITNKIKEIILEPVSE